MRSHGTGETSTGTDMAAGRASVGAKRPRVVVYVDSTTLGGHEITSAEVVEVLASSGAFEVVFLAAQEELRRRVAHCVSTEPTPAKNALPLPGLRNLRPAAVLRTAKRFRQLRANLVVVVQGNIEIGLVGLLAARLAGVRLVSYIPLAFTFRESGAPLARLRDLIDRLYYRLPAAFITVTEYQASLLRRFSRAPTYVARSPMQPRERDAEPLRDDSARRPGPIRVATIGRIFFRQKNQNVLPAVVRRLREMGQSVVVDVIGDGPDRARLEELSRELGTEDAIRIHGWLSRDEVRQRMLCQTDVVLAPSWFEGMPMVLVEALGSGRTILASDRPFIREYGLPSHYLVDPTSPAQIAERVSSLARDGEPHDLHAIADRVLGLHAPTVFEGSLVEAVRRELGQEC